ncbi:MAG: hypothetical protein WC295_12120 [Methanoregula sp.]
MPEPARFKGYIPVPLPVEKTAIVYRRTRELVPEIPMRRYLLYRYRKYYYNEPDVLD